MCEVFLCRLKFMSMNKHVFIVILSVLGLIPVSLFSRSRVVNDTIFSKKLNTERVCSILSASFIR